MGDRLKRARENMFKLMLVALALRYALQLLGPYIPLLVSIIVVLAVIRLFIRKRQP